MSLLQGIPSWVSKFKSRAIIPPMNITGSDDITLLVAGSTPAIDGCGKVSPLVRSLLKINCAI